MAGSNRNLVIRAWKAFGGRDAAEIAAFFSHDAEWIAPRGNATAVALDMTDHMKGAKEIAAFLAEGFAKLFVDDVKLDFRGFYADGDIVVVEERMRAVLANGNAYENDYCFVFVCRDGKIVQVREYMDTMKGHRMIFGSASGDGG